METNLKFNSQICTTKIQSEQLLALGLKKETADMVLLKELAYDEKRHCLCDADTYMIRPINYLNGEEHRGNIPAWTLDRLIEILDIWYLDLDFHNFANAYEQVISYFEERVKGGFIKKEYLEEL